ncbi:MAG TPA: TonB-dependent receptor [Bryobacteraceae bacterium]|nr:TonB-dependent receptor [Bryobacteraceae bacterium]
MNLHRRLCGRHFLAILLLTVAVRIPAQLTVSTIRGSVVDPTGAAVVGAKITVVNVQTSVERSVETNQTGEYEIADLQRGTYKLTATQTGFRTFVAENVILETSQIRRVNVTFELGSVGSEVTVRADAAVIATDTSKLQGALGSKRIEDIPVIGDARNPQMMLTTMPLVQSSGGIYNIQVAGQPAAQVQTGIDGFAVDGTSTQVSNIHVVEELVVVQGNNSAEFARVGHYNLASKAGGNQLHGRLAYWHQNTALTARSFFDVQKPKNTYHTFVGEVSGPIVKDKTFFYFNWNGQRFPMSTYYLRDVPTDSMRRGDFSALLSLSRPVTVRDPLNNTPFPDNVIPASRLNATAVKIQDRFLPAPNLGGPGQMASNFGYLHPFPSDSLRYDYYSGRVDHRFSSGNTAYFRWSTSPNTYVLDGGFPALAWTRLRDKHVMIIEDTHVFSAQLVNTFRVGYHPSKLNDGTEVAGVKPLTADQVISDLGLQGVNRKNVTGVMGSPRFNITGYNPIFVRTGGIIGDEKYWGFADSMTWAFGRHVLKFGGEYKPVSNFDGSVPQENYGVFTFNGSLSGNAHSDFLLGLPYSSQRIDPLIGRTQVSSEFGVYVQDTFKVNSRLNLDAGLRWDRFGAADYKDGLIFNWDPQTGDVIVPPEGQTSISPLYPASIKVRTGQVKVNPSLRNFAPRVGFAYRPFGEAFVMRGGYGLYTETIGRYARAQNGGPYQLGETFFNSVQGGQPLFAFPNPFPAGAGQIASQSVSGYPLDTKNGQIHQFNFTLERQVRNIGLRLSYLGSRSRNLNYTIQTNKPEPSMVAFSQGRRPYSQFVGTTYARTNGAANFNALTFEVQRKVGQLTFDAHWTLASNYSNTLNLENPYAPLFWNRDAFTSRQRAVINTIWTIPVGTGRTYLSSAPAVVDHILGGWRLYWIVYAETGQFFTPSFSGSDPSNTNTSGGLPDRIANGNLPSGERRLGRWFDPAAFVVPAKGTFGNSGVNILEGPGLHEHNITIAKDFKLNERMRFTLMAAMQNAFNHPNFNNPTSANISTPGTVGVINSTRAFAPGRQIMLRGQLAF